MCLPPRLPELPADAIFALLDDASQQAATDVARHSRLYTGFIAQHRCHDPQRLDAFWADIDAALANGHFAVVLADYEWGVALQRQHSAADSASSMSHAPALRVLLFTQMTPMSAADTERWFAQTLPTPERPAGIIDCRAAVSWDEFAQAISRIHEALHAGECYQINYTFRLDFDVYGSPLSLYRQLRTRQKAAYGALIRTPEQWVLSLSPERFVAHHDGVLLAEPMKGTAARANDSQTDAELGEELARDPKNRAENVMIVDLLRNDLGRLAPPGGVSVDRLFAVEAFPTVWQMTSTVRAALPPHASFPDVLRALFPCGSITGAPKHAAMAMIEALEATPRGLYTGAIGWVDPPQSAELAEHVERQRRCPNFSLSVAIRTVTVDLEPAGDARLLAARASVGAGIVLDSRALDEYEECWLKARFLTGADPGFTLFETMRAEGGHIAYRERHLQRMADAARRLGFTWHRAAAERALSEALAANAATTLQRVKLTLDKQGTMHCTTFPLAPFAPLQADVAVIDVAVILASDAGWPCMPSSDPLRLFKSSERACYDRGWQTAERQGAFDMLFINERGHLTEGGRSNLFVQLDGCWYTPPLDDGVLPGVMRAVLLDDPAWAVSIRSITLVELRRAERIVVCNALRGVLRAEIVSPAVSPAAPTVMPNAVPGPA